MTTLDESMEKLRVWWHAFIDKALDIWYKYWKWESDIHQNIWYEKCKQKAIEECDKIMKTYKNFWSMDDTREFIALAKVFQAINNL